MNSCYLCFNNQSGTTLINGPRGVHLCIADIICLHFGFEPLTDTGQKYYICDECWQNLNEFHIFYKFVKSKHQSLTNSLSKDKTVSLGANINEHADSSTELNTSFNIKSVKTDCNSLEEVLEYSSNELNTTLDIKMEKSDHHSLEQVLDDNVETNELNNAFEITYYKTDQEFTSITNESDKHESHTSFEITYEQSLAVYREQTSIAPLKVYNNRNDSSNDQHSQCEEDNNSTLLNAQDLPSTNDETSSDKKVLKVKKANFNCKLCPKSYKRKHSLKLHISTHHREIAAQEIGYKIGLIPPFYTCDICSKRIYKKNDLQDHMDKHCGIAVWYSCTFCSKSFKYRSYIYRHRKSMHKNELATVSEIKKKQQTSSYLNCYKCKIILKTEHLFKEHMIIHMGIRIWYTCVFCKQSSKSYDFIKLHRDKDHPQQKILTEAEYLNQTTGTSRRYSCTICEKTFACATSIYGHRKSQHPKEYTI